MTDQPTTPCDLEREEGGSDSVSALGRSGEGPTASPPARACDLNTTRRCLADQFAAFEALLARAEASEKQRVELEAQTTASLAALCRQLASLEQRLTAALGEVKAWKALSEQNGERRAVLALKLAGVEEKRDTAQALLHRVVEAVEPVLLANKEAGVQGLADCTDNTGVRYQSAWLDEQLAALATLSSEITALLPSGTGEAKGEGR